MNVLTCKKTVTKGNYTYKLMGDFVHINNHKTNNKSIIVPVSEIKELIQGV